MSWGYDKNRNRRHGDEMDIFDKVDTSLNLATKSAKLLGGIGVGIGGAMALRKVNKRKEMEKDRNFALEVQNKQFEQKMMERDVNNRNQNQSTDSMIFSNNASAPSTLQQPANTQNQQQKLLDAFSMKQAGAITDEEYNLIKKQVLGF